MPLMWSDESHAARTRIPYWHYESVQVRGYRVLLDVCNCGLLIIARTVSKA